MHKVIDDALNPISVRAYQDAWPYESPAWIRYDSLGEYKFALTRGIPDVLFGALQWLDQMCPATLQTDQYLHGAGLHHMPVGGRLDPHLDCDQHPITKFRRARNAILFLDDFESDWGGDLCLYDPDLSGRCERITPRAGRVVWFDCTDDSYHGVPGPICGPIPRRSLAVYWWEPIDWQPKRPRAQFVGLANETPDPEKERWRAARSVASVAVR
ncbi:MAG: 2OG-Fe(II) oxygenase [Planctomycetota bacterium]|nr:2OG-Fe(II) oxygenase [Planctomycetota bacterium]